MSHSEHTKRGYSVYIEKWDKSAKKYIVTCKICGHRGYSPVIEQKGFDWVIRRELSHTLRRLELDELGRCPDCARIMER